MKKWMLLIGLGLSFTARGQQFFSGSDYGFLHQMNIGMNGNYSTDTTAWLEIGALNTNKGFLPPRSDTNSMPKKAGSFMYEISANRFYYSDGVYWYPIGSDTLKSPTLQNVTTSGDTSDNYLVLEDKGLQNFATAYFSDDRRYSGQTNLSMLTNPSVSFNTINDSTISDFSAAHPAFVFTRTYAHNAVTGQNPDSVNHLGPALEAVSDLKYDTSFSVQSNFYRPGVASYSLFEIGATTTGYTFNNNQIWSENIPLAVNASMFDMQDIPDSDNPVKRKVLGDPIAEYGAYVGSGLFYYPNNGQNDLNLNVGFYYYGAVDSMGGNPIGAVLDTSIAFYVRPQKGPGANITNSYGFVQDGINDYNAFAGKVRIGGFGDSLSYLMPEVPSWESYASAQLDVHGKTLTDSLAFRSLRFTSPAVAPNGVHLTLDSLGNIILARDSAFRDSSSGNFIANDTTVQTANFDISGTGTINGNTIVQGNVLIGKSTQSNTSYRLDVNGNARVNEIVVNTTGADYVFSPSYRLTPLDTLARYLAVYQHLPGIKPAGQMQAEGLNLGATQAILLAKIEELTLYLIRQHRQIQVLQREIGTLKKKATVPNNKKYPDPEIIDRPHVRFHKMIMKKR